MSYDTVRAGLTQKVLDILTAYDSTLLVEFDNKVQKDKNKPETFVHVRLRFNNAEQIGMNTSAPGIRHQGELQLFAMCKSGGGTKKVLEIVQALTDGLKFQLIAGAQLQAPRLAGGVDLGDWYSLPLMVSFYTDAY